MRLQSTNVGSTRLTSKRPANAGCGWFCPLQNQPMETRFVMIDKGEVERLLQMCVRAEGFCRNARPATSPFTKEDLYAEPTEFYSGSSGYAGATMREVICTLESSLEE